MKEVMEILNERLVVIQQEYIDYSNNPFDEKRAHHLRVSIRRLRALLNLMKPNIIPEEYDLINEQLKECARIYGPVRERDVLIELCGNLARKNATLSDHYYDLFNHLTKERRKEMRRTFNKTNVKIMEQTLETLRHKFDNFSDAIVDNDIDWNKFLTKRFSKKHKKLVKAYDSLDYNDYETVHSVRKDAKKVRYTAKYFSEILDTNTKESKNMAKKIQTELGTYTDAHVNQELLDYFVKNVSDDNLSHLFKELKQLETNT